MFHKIDINKTNLYGEVLAAPYKKRLNVICKDNMTNKELTTDNDIRDVLFDSNQLLLNFVKKTFRYEYRFKI